MMGLKSCIVFYLLLALKPKEAPMVSARLLCEALRKVSADCVALCSLGFLPLTHQPGVYCKKLWFCRDLSVFCPYDQKKDLAEKLSPRFLTIFWWEMQVSNLRPLQCECNALPLS